MRPRRRTLLKVAGAVGLGGGGVAYWQRRRIRRRDDLDAIETALDVPLPTVPDPVTVTADHLEASYSWAREHVDTTERNLPESEAEGSRHLENANEYLAGRSPGEVDDGDERHDALGAYRVAVASSATARGQYAETDDGSPSDDLQRAHETLGDELDAFESTYADESLTRTVVQVGHVESLVGTAASRHSRAGDFVTNEQHRNSVAWETVETGRFALHDAERFLEALESDDAPDRAADLEDRYDRLDERIESATDGVEWEYEPDVQSQAYERWIDVRSDHFGEPESSRDDGRLARAVSIQAERATVAETLDEFDDVPGWRDLGDVDVELIDDAAELVDEKRTVRERLEATADAVGSDPLGAHLLRRAIRGIERTDSTLDRLRDDVRSYDSAAWQYELDRAALRYRGGVADADAIPDVVEIVADQA
ncbi:hypothetical protein [Halovivax sp.]|uniref:hypothetical protein n=1 Tax=Halovivax sp. TaxID=1935978 RepID=UPI0025C6D133|nr:hypothetical protein [Halovivax sp.]